VKLMGKIGGGFEFHIKNLFSSLIVLGLLVIGLCSCLKLNFVMKVHFFYFFSFFC
jgi:hypothetical protein